MTLLVDFFIHCAPSTPLHERRIRHGRGITDEGTV